MSHAFRMLQLLVHFSKVHDDVTATGAPKQPLEGRYLPRVYDTSYKAEPHILPVVCETHWIKCGRWCRLWRISTFIQYIKMRHTLKSGFRSWRLGSLNHPFVVNLVINNKTTLFSVQIRFEQRNTSRHLNFKKVLSRKKFKFLISQYLMLVWDLHTNMCWYKRE